MSTLATIRPDDWDLPLFLHVLGAMTMFGALVVAASFLFVAREGEALLATRRGFRTLLYAAIPAYVVMRGGAEWMADKEGLTDSDVTWIGIGYGVSDIGLLLVLVATIVTGLAVRRAAAADGETPSSASVAIARALVALTILGFLLAIWAMSTKPV